MEQNVEVHSRNQIKVATLVSYISIAVNIISGLLFTPWLIHQLGDGDYGIYSIGTSIITLLIMDFGISEAVAKYVAQYRTEGKEEKVTELLSLVTKIYLILALIFLVLFSVLYFFLGNIYAGLTAGELIKLKNVYIIIAIYNVFAFAFTPLSGIMLAYEHLVSLKLCDIVLRLLTIVITIIAIINGLGLYSAVMANAIAGVAVIAYKLYIIQSNHRFKIDLAYQDNDLLKKIFSFSVWVALLVITQRCIYSITPSILGALSSSNEVTLYSVSSALEGYAYSFGSVISTLFLAKITRQLESGDHEGFNKLIITTGKIQFLLCVIILGGFICVGNDFINLWMGNGYEITYIMTVILLIPSIFIWPFMTASVGLTVANRVKGPALVNLGTACINILMECILVGKLGAFGAVLSIVVANSFKGIALIFVYKKYLPIRLHQFIKEVFVVYGIPLGIMTVVGRNLLKFISLEGTFGFVIKGITILILYTITILLASKFWDCEFCQFIKGYIRKRKSE